MRRSPLTRAQKIVRILATCIRSRWRDYKGAVSPPHLPLPRASYPPFAKSAGTISGSMRLELSEGEKEPE